MEEIRTVQDIEQLTGNQFIGTPPRKFENASIVFEGIGNILYCEPGVMLVDSTITFHGNNALIILHTNRSNYCLHIDIHNNSVIYIGKHNYFNDVLHLSASEEKHIFIGDEGLFSFGVWMRTADPHLIYNAQTMQRTNYSQSIFLGDHIWVGQDALILKNSKIGSGSIVGAKALVSNRKIPSNTSWGGVPARQIGSDIFWDRTCVHSWTHEKTQANVTYQKRTWIYTKGSDTLSMNVIDQQLAALKSPQEKLDYLLKEVDSKNTSRFCIPFDPRNRIFRRRTTSNPSIKKHLSRFWKTRLRPFLGKIKRRLVALFK